MNISNMNNLEALSPNEMLSIDGGDAKDVGRAVGYTIGFAVGVTIGAIGVGIIVLGKTLTS